MISRVNPSLRIATLIAFSGHLFAQVKSPAEGIRDLEARLAEDEKLIEELKKEVEGKKAGKEKNVFSEGILTVGGVKFRLGGKAEILFIDSRDERDPVVGATEEPDPHFELNRLRLEPRLDWNKEVFLESQIDFRPQAGRTILKELTAHHKAQPVWWFGSDAKVGLDDRFIRPARETKNYPLIGNAFWRDEEVAFQWALSFGDKNGRPEGKKKAGVKKPKAPQKGISARGGGGPQEEAQEENGATPEDEEEIEPTDPEGTVVVKSRRSGDPFDFGRNFGEWRTYFSIGNGYTLNNNEIGFDGAGFNDIVQDDRNVTRDFSLRDLGFGLRYRRSFSWLGDFEALAFYYNDRLNDSSVQFLQQDLTLRDIVTGQPTAGYGDSNSRISCRYGAGAEYFLPASIYMPADSGVRGNDGLRISGQWIRGRDGELKRDGWYLQGSYRYSFHAPLIFDRYLKSIEPIARYGALSTNLGPVPQLPATWDRRQLLIGLITEFTKNVLLKAEYTFNMEKTGGNGARPGPGSVDNDELMLELLLQF
jgi:hypothetical protein